VESVAAARQLNVGGAPPSSCSWKHGWVKQKQGPSEDGPCSKPNGPGYLKGN